MEKTFERVRGGVEMEIVQVHKCPKCSHELATHEGTSPVRCKCGYEYYKPDMVFLNGVLLLKRWNES